MRQLRQRKWQSQGHQLTHLATELGHAAQHTPRAALVPCRMRLLVVAVLFIALVVGGLFAFGVLPPGEREPELPDLFVVLEQNDPAAITDALGAGADMHVRNEAGLSPLQAAVSGGASTRSEERRVGEEWRWRWAAYQLKKES